MESRWCLSKVPEERSLKIEGQIYWRTFLPLDGIPEREGRCQRRDRVLGEAKFLSHNYKWQWDLQIHSIHESPARLNLSLLGNQKHYINGSNISIEDGDFMSWTIWTLADQQRLPPLQCQSFSTFSVCFALIEGGRGLHGVVGGHCRHLFRQIFLFRQYSTVTQGKCAMSLLHFFAL